MGSRCAERAMRRIGEARVPPEPANGQYAFAMLGYTEVCRVDFPDVNLIAHVNQRLQEVENEPAATRGEEALNILKDECLWAVPGNETRVDSHQRVPLVAGFTPPRRRETLTRWPTRDHIRGRESGGIVNALCRHMIANVGPVRIHCRSPDIDSADGLKPCLPQPQREPTRSAEQIDECWCQDAHAPSVRGDRPSGLRFDRGIPQPRRTALRPRDLQ